MSGSVRRVARLGAVLLAASLLWACEGDDGPAGPPGPPGPPGQPGDPGTPGTGGNAVPIESADRINIEVSSVTIPAGGGQPVVELKLTDDLNRGLEGLSAGEIRLILAQLSPAPPGSGGSSEWQSYTTRAAGQQATTETATDGTFVDNGDGTYQYTFAQALDDYEFGPTFDETKTHRLGIEIRGQAPITGNGVITFLPTGGDPTFTRDIVDNDTCNACHDRLEFHGGPRTDVPYCVTCHNPYSIDPDTGNTVDMKAMIHNIHVGRHDYVIIGFGGTEYDYSEIEFTQDVRNCTTCHEESDENTPQASNWRQVVNRASCGTCHRDDPDDDRWNFQIQDGQHPAGLQFNDDSQCLNCHGPDATLGISVAEVHAIPEQQALENFQYEVLDVANTAPGENPTVTIRVSNPTDGTNYDILDPAGPFQVGSSRLNVDISWDVVRLGNLDPNDDLARPADSGPPFPPITVGFQDAASVTDNGDGTFSATAAEVIPTGIEGSGLAAIEGRAAVDIDGSLTNLPVAGEDIFTFAITDSEPQPRPTIANIDKCNDCHQNLALHGENRSGSTEVCSTCHNANATDIQRRVDAASECVTELGADDETIDMKVMVHAIHAGTIGICGYRDSAHPYFDVVYPGQLNNCEGCHEPGTYYPVDADERLATSIDAGPGGLAATADRSTLTDDVAISPNSAVCSACHTSDLARQHMIQNGGDFEAGKDDNGNIISSGVETCSLCHGPGRSADVGEVHGVGFFEFN